MYVRDGRAYVMLNDFGRYVRDGGNPYGKWVQSSEILAFDVTDPARIKDLTSYDVPGSIADSRIVGDALYLVTYENGYCWHCSDAPATIVTSFDVTGGGSIAKVDQLVYKAADKSYTSWQRSVSATNERLYIAGPEWSWTANQTDAKSVIQVVDIRDPKGHLVKGADVPVAGQINSRWQMEEYEGVLRVVSQFGNGWWGPNGNNNPIVQTFTVASAQSITPLGSTQLTLPKPESLRSVRFDGTRGYAITAERSDPLFTIDLSNPSAPKQAGELEMPGWIFHMEPRGDRLVGFGYEDTTWNSRLAVSLFDVSDLTKPTMLKRVPFGNGWGMPRRAFLANNRLLAISDRNVTSFDIASRDLPVKKNEIDLSNPAYRMVELPSHVASITNDWWSGEVMLSLTDKQQADDANAVGKLSLAGLATPSAELCNGRSGWAAWYAARLTTHDHFIYVTVPVYTYTQSSRGGRVVVAAIDVANPQKPVLAGKTEMVLTERSTEYGWYGWYGDGFWDGYGFYSYLGGVSGGLVGSGTGLVQLGTKLAYLELDHEPYEVYVPGSTGSSGGSGTTGGKRWATRIHRKLHVVDMANPAAPVVHQPLELGDSLGSSPLHLASGKVLTSRWIPSDKTPGKVRFFVDRVDISGATPERLSSINTPGSLLAFDEPSSRMVTVDYAVTRKAAADYSDCYKTVGYRAFYDWQSNECILVTRTFKLADVADTKVALKQSFTPPSQNFGGVQLADDRIYVTRYRVYDYNARSTPTNGVYEEPPVLEDGGLWAIGGIRAGTLSIVSEMKGDAEWPLAANGTKVALYTQGGFSIYDTATPTPRLLVEANLRGYGYSSHVLLGESRAIASLGDWGIQTIGF